MYGKSIIEKVLPLLVWYRKLTCPQNKVKSAGTVKHTQSICDTCGDTGFVDEVKIIAGKGVITPCPNRCHKQRSLKE